MNNKPEHKRRNSQLDLFYSQKSKSKGKQNRQPKSVKKQKQIVNKKENKIKLSNQAVHGQNVLKLLADTNKKNNQKSYIVQKINSAQTIHNNLINSDCPNQSYNTIQEHSPIRSILDRDDFQNFQDFQIEQQQDNESHFFQFGKRRKSVQKPLSTHLDLQNINMQQITQVPDTMSNERRYQKQNLYDFSEDLRKRQCSEQQEDDDQNQHNYFYSRKQAQTTKPSTEYLKKDIKAKGRKKKMTIKDKQQLDDINFDLSSLNLKSKKLLGIKNNQNKSKKKNIKIPNQNDEQNENIIQKQRFIKRQPQSARSTNSKQNKKKTTLKKDLSFLCLKHNKNQNYNNILSLTKNTQSNSSNSNINQNKNKNKSLSLKQRPSSYSKQIQSKTSIIINQNKKKSKQFFSQQSHKTLLTKQKLYQRDKKFKTIKYNKNQEIGLKQKIKLIEENQNKLQKQYKMLWECVGDLWENNRITRYITEKNKADLITLRDTDKKHQQDLINMKTQIINTITSARY